MSFLKQLAEYTIYSGSGYYYAKNGNTGVVDYGGPSNLGGATGSDATDVIMSAIGNLTADRTWRETVFVKGNIGLNKWGSTSGSIFIPSLCNFIYAGKLKLSDSQDCDILRNMATKYSYEGRVLLTADCNSSATTATLAEVDHMMLGDSINIADDDDGSSSDYNVGAGHKAKITVINTGSKVVTFSPATSADYTTAKNAYCYTENHSISIRGWEGVLDGNRDNNTTGSGIRFENHVNPFAWSGETQRTEGYKVLFSVEFDNVAVLRAGGIGWNINSKYASGQTYAFKDCNVEYSSGQGVRFHYLADSHLTGGLWEGGIYLDNALQIFHPDYVNGNVHVFGGAYTNISCRQMWDMGSTDVPAIIGEYMTYANVHDILFHIIGSGGYTPPAIRLDTWFGETGCDENNFCNLTATRGGGGGTNIFSYVVEETDVNQQSNRYTNIQGLDCSSGSLRILGSGSMWTPNSTVGKVVLV